MVFNALIMIRKNLINCKLFLEKRSGRSIYSECMDHLGRQEAVCPFCGARNTLRIHSYYKRTLIDLVDNKPVRITLYICRLICPSCLRPSTHAVLPDPVIPYCRHSLRFILRVLAEHLFHLRSVERICEAFDISVRTFYRWQKLFQDHMKEWQGFLAASLTDLKMFLLDLLRKDPFSSFASSFIQKTRFSFLQSHKNPVPPTRKYLSDPGFP